MSAVNPGKHRLRFVETDSLRDLVIKLVEGNPGAITAVMDMVKVAPAVDPDSAFGEWGPAYDLDHRGIYGSRIWLLYSDVCGRNAARVLALFRAVQLGMMPEADLLAAIEAGDRSQHTLDVPAIVRAVREQLPNFDRGNLADVGPADAHPSNANAAAPPREAE